MKVRPWEHKALSPTMATRCMGTLYSDQHRHILSAYSNLI